MKIFNNYHPFVIFTFFISTIVITMFTFHPVILGISVFSSLAYSFVLKNNKAFLISLLYYIPVLLIVMLINPLFTHAGKTVLFFLNDRAITLEAFLYGVSMAMMILSVFHWFHCYNHVMTSDKFTYLFGKIIPSIGLTISIGLNFIPKLIRQSKKINQVQKTLGLYSSGGWIDKLRNAIRLVSSLISWALENSIDTAVSMKARGYGLKGRTQFSMYSFHFTDYILLAVNMAVISLFFFGIGRPILKYSFYPIVSQVSFGIIHIIIYSIVFIFMLIPTILEIKENIKWHYLKSKI